MKKRKLPYIGILLLLVTVMAGLLAGCAKKPDGESVIQEVKEALMKQSLLGAVWTVKAVYPESDAAGRTDLTLEVNGNTQADIDNHQTHTSLETAPSVQTTEQEQIRSSEIYTERTNEKTTDIYVMAQASGGEEWFVVSREYSQTETGNGAGDISTALLGFVQGGFENLALAENPVEMDGKTYYQINGDISTDKLSGQGELLLDILDFLVESDGFSMKDVLKNNNIHMVLLVSKADHLPGDMKLTASEGSRSAEITVRFDFSLNGSGLSVPEAAKEGTRLEDLVDIADILRASEGADSLDDPYPGQEGSVYDSMTNPVLVREFASGDPDAVVWTDENAEIRILRVYTGKASSYADIEVVNKSDKDLEIESRYASVNRVMSEENFYLALEPGEEKTVCLYIPGLDRTGIPAVLGLAVAGMDTATYDDLFASELKEIALSETEPETAEQPGGAVVLDDDQIRVTVYPADSSEDYMTAVPFAILNKTGQALTVDSRDVTSSGTEIEGYLYGQVLGGHLLYTSLSVEARAMRKAGLEELTDLQLRLELSDPVTYETIRVTEPISIP